MQMRYEGAVCADDGGTCMWIDGDRCRLHDEALTWSGGVFLRCNKCIVTEAPYED